MSVPLKLLLAEDNPQDAELLIFGLRRAGYESEWKRVCTEKDFVESLQDDYDLIISDFEMPQFNGLRALELCKKAGKETPFMIVSGTIGEETAVEAMKQGAVDYLLKDRLARLGQAVGHALEKNRLLQEYSAATEAMTMAEAKYQNIFENAVEGIFQTTEDGRFIVANPAMARIFGYNSPDELISSVTNISEQLYVDAGKRLELALVMKVHGQIDNMEARVRRKDGSVIWAAASARTVQRGDGKVYYEGMVADITDRKRAEEQLRTSEERFRQLAENTHEIFWMMDAVSGQFLYVSSAFDQIWGRPRVILYENPKNILEHIHAEDRAKMIAFRQQPPDKRNELEYRAIRPDGTIRWIRSRSFPVRDAKGRVYRVAGLDEDISERRQLEEQFRQTQKMEAIGTLAGGIAHDFNNILGAISGYTELIKLSVGNKVGGDTVENLDAIAQAVRRAADLVKQILAFSRQQELKRTPIKLQRVVAESIKLLRATIPATIDFKSTLSANAPTVLADATQIHQVVMNLGTNAWHAMKDRPGRLEIKLEDFNVDVAMAELHPRLRVGRYAQLTVTDTGKGMDRTTQERIFEPFFTTKPPGEGTGLGLSVVHGIMQTHDGLITVYSQPGQGTTFHLYFPAHLNDAAEITAAVAPTPRGNGERILFVDDEVPLAQLGKKVLTMLGYQAESATTPADVLKTLREKPDKYDMIITDQTMPGMTGIDLAGFVLEIRPDIPIVLTTGYVANLTSERIRAKGLRELLVKPLTVHMLGTAVHQILHETKTN